jgi:hypothetical protein
MNLYGFIGLEDFVKDLYIFESSLGAKELTKINSKTGEPRAEILKRKIKNNEPLETTDGKFFIVTDITDAIKKIDNIDPFATKTQSITFIGTIDNKETTISSSKLKKTDEFGGGSGTRGGAVQTDVTESAQCYYCSVVCNVLGGEGSENDFTPDNLRKAAQWVKASSSVDKVISDLSDEWIESSIMIANALFSNGYMSKGAVFHRGSVEFDTIYKKAKQALTLSEISMQNDKWNPADIFIFNDSINVNDLNSTSIGALNNQMLELFNNKQLIGVSLKLVKSKPIVDVLNGGQEKSDIKPIEYLLGTGGRSTFDSNAKVFIKFVGGICEGRAFQQFTNWAFEIQGKNAAGGKCGLSSILSILKLNGETPPILDSRELKILSNNPTENFLDEMFLLYNEYDNEHKYDKNQFNEFIINLSKKPATQNWIYSKYVGMKIIDAIKKSKDEVAVLNDIILYAASQSSISSVFVKAYDK